MALFSFRHSVKSFSEKRTDETRAAKSGQTAAHLRYITRPQAARVVVRERLSSSTLQEVANLAEEDAQKRKGRVCERFVIALPTEASPDQREALTRAFADRLSKGAAGYVVAIHDKSGNDIANPHAHFVFFDVHQKTGGRGRPRSTLGLARKHAIEDTARLWADTHNSMMGSWGHGPETMISPLSYADRGIRKIPTIHEGASARATADSKRTSKEKWRKVDQGHSRAEANVIIREINRLSEAIENERSVRLGNSDARLKAERGGGFPEQRECGCRNGQVAPRKPSPFAESSKPRGQADHVGNRSQPTGSPQSSGSSRERRQLPPFRKTIGADLRRRNGRRLGIRRIYIELVMLRDTMRSRLLLFGKRRFDPMENQTRSNLINVEKAKPRRSGADQEV